MREWLAGRAAVLPAVVSGAGWHTPTTRGQEWHKHVNGHPSNCCFQINCVLLIYSATSDRFRRVSLLQGPHVLDMVFFKKVISSMILELNKNLHITDLLIIFSLLWVYLQISVIDLCGQMGAFVSCCLSVQQNPCMLCSTVGLNFHLKCTTVHKF